MDAHTDATPMTSSAAGSLMGSAAGSMVGGNAVACSLIHLPTCIKCGHPFDRPYVSLRGSYRPSLVRRRCACVVEGSNYRPHTCYCKCCGRFLVSPADVWATTPRDKIMKIADHYKRSTAWKRHADYERSEKCKAPDIPEWLKTKDVDIFQPTGSLSDEDYKRIGIPREAVEECPFQGPFLNGGEQLDKLEASGADLHIAAQAGIQEDDLGGKALNFQKALTDMVANMNKPDRKKLLLLLDRHAAAQTASVVEDLANNYRIVNKDGTRTAKMDEFVQQQLLDRARDKMKAPCTEADLRATSRKMQNIIPRAGFVEHDKDHRLFCSDARALTRIHFAKGLPLNCGADDAIGLYDSIHAREQRKNTYTETVMYLFDGGKWEPLPHEIAQHVLADEKAYQQKLDRNSQKKTYEGEGYVWTIDFRTRRLKRQSKELDSGSMSMLSSEKDGVVRFGRHYVLPIPFFVWSDGFVKNDTRQAAGGSVWLMLISICPKGNDIFHPDCTYVYAISMDKSVDTNLAYLTLQL